MKVTLLTYYTPYKENLRGVSALPYYLIKYRPKDVELKIYTLNINNLDEQLIENVSKELGVEIILAKYTNWQYKYRNNKIYGLISRFFINDWRSSFHLAKDTLMEINNDKAEIIWVYMMYLCDNLKKIHKSKFLVTGCDDPVLFFSRQMKLWKKRSILYRLTIGLHRFQAEVLAKKASRFPLHVVGVADKKFYKRRYPQSCVYYIAHPHYKIIDKKIKFSRPKLNVLWAGAYDLYMKEGADELVKSLCQNAAALKDKIKISFLGKGWDDINMLLINSGYESRLLGWVDDYVEEVSKYDIQLTPISLGSGTKAKVLDAMANGVLVVGSPYAMESICEDNVGGIMYQHAEEVPNILLDIFNDCGKYEKVAAVGRERARLEHSPKYTSIQLFEVLKNSV